MSRTNSEFLPACETTMQIFQAIADAVFQLGGTDDDLRRILTEPRLADRLANVIIPRQNVVAKIVAEFTVRVDYSDPRWQRIDRKRYAYVAGPLMTDHFPVNRSGEAPVIFVDLVFSRRNLPTLKEILAEADRLGLWRPDRAESETSFDSQSVEGGDRSVICFCGKIWKNSLGDTVIGSVIERSSGRVLGVHNLDGYFDPKGDVFRFVRRSTLKAAV